MKARPPESEPAPVPPLPTGPGSYVLTDGKWALQSVTQPPDDSAFRLQQTPVVNGQTGDDLRDLIQPNGDGGDPGAGSKADDSGHQGDLAPQP